MRRTPNERPVRPILRQPPDDAAVAQALDIDGFAAPPVEQIGAPSAALRSRSSARGYGRHLRPAMSCRQAWLVPFGQAS